MMKMTKKNAAVVTALAVVLVLPESAFAATGTAFKPAYDFVYGAATGYLGRAIAITGGLIGIGAGAASGKALPAVVGIVLAMFGALGPTIINSIFASGAMV